MKSSLTLSLLCVLQICATVKKPEILIWVSPETAQFLDELKAQRSVNASNRIDHTKHTVELSEGLRLVLSHAPTKAQRVERALLVMLKDLCMPGAEFN